MEGEMGKRGRHDEKKGGGLFRIGLTYFEVRESRSKREKGKNRVAIHPLSRINNFEKSCYFNHRQTMWSSEQAQPSGSVQVRSLILTSAPPPHPPGPPMNQLHQIRQVTWGQRY